MLMTDCDTLNFFIDAGLLKRIPRSGWLLAGVAHPESVAEHSWRTSLIAYCFAKEEGLDPFKCATMALIHDIAEVRVWDLPWITRSYVHKNEMDAASDMLKGDLFDLWCEVERKKTDEAKLVKDADYFETLLTAYEYFTSGYKIAGAFFEDLGDPWRTKVARKYFQLLTSRGEGGVSSFWKGFIKGTF